MTVKSVLSKLDFTPDKEELAYLKKETADFVEKFRDGLRKKKIDADVFVGGSFAKGTLSKQDNYDVDVFVRFDWKYDGLSDMVEGVLKRLGIGFDRVHGSRDYFRIEKSDKLTFEIVPVLRVKKVREARNITDLSYFHVNYVRRAMKKELRRDLGLAKRFFRAQKVYGAESYIQGFSGYALECLIIHYGGFEKMLKGLVKLKDKIVIDPAKRYNKKGDVLFEMNEARLQSPIILVDPTWKERNVLAALSKETLDKLKVSAKNFLARPSPGFFERKEVNIDMMKKRKGEFVHVVLGCDRQEGDIAGTKMKKFARFLERESRVYFEVLDCEFVYGLGQKADLYLVLKPRKEVVRQGPILDMGKQVKAFRAANRGKVFELKGRLWARETVDFSGKEFLERFAKKEKQRVEEMGIVSFTVKK